MQSVVWGVNAFDQWGVELGKQLCEGIAPAVRQGVAPDQASSSLRGNLEAIVRMRD